MTPAACGGTGSSVKRSQYLSRPIPSIGLGRDTTTRECLLFLCVYISINFASTRCMYVMCLMSLTDSFDDRWSQCHLI